MQSTITTDRDVATVGTDQVTITVTLRDASGMPLAGVVVQLVATGTENTITVPPPTDATGTTHATWSSLRAEPKAVTATVGTVTIGPHTVTFVAGTASTLAFTTEPGDVVAGGPFTPAVTVAAEDAYGNIETSTSAGVTITIGANPGSTTLRGTSVGWLAAGVATFPSLHVDVPGSGYTLVASTAGLTGAVSVPFDVSLGSVDGTRSTLVAIPPSVDADGVSATTIVATLANAYGIPIPGAPVALAVSGSNNVLSATNGTSDADGVVSATLRSTTAELKTATAQSGSTVLTTTIHFYPPACIPMLPGAPWTRLSASGSVLLVSDVDGDGKPDAIVGEPGTQLAVYRGRGDGRFSPEIDLPITTTVVAMASGDFNGDGKVDLVLSASDASALAVALGTGGGHFATPTSVPLPAAAYNVVVADFNHDGKLDLAVNIPNLHELEVLIGQGDGTFAAGPSFTSYDCLDLVALDLNKDGKLDLLASCGGLLAVLGKGDGTFQAPVNTGAGAEGHLIVGDFNGDTFPDVAVASAGVAATFLGKGNGTFATPGHFIDTAENGDSSAVPPRGGLVEDLDGDGKQDLLVAAGTTLTVLKGAGDGTFMDTAAYTGAFYHAAFVDMNGDGVRDIVSISSSEVGVSLGEPGGTFLAPPAYPLAGGELLDTSGDFNASAPVDLAVRSDYSVGVLLMNPDGTLGSALTSASLSSLDHGVAGDVNGDGKLDLAAVYDTGTGTQVDVALGNGDGTLQAPTMQTIASTRVTTARLADLNRDGDADLIATNDSSQGVWIALNQGGGTFGAFSQVTSLPGRAVDDLDGDGVPDIVAFDANGNLMVYLVNATGGVDAPITSSTQGHPGAAVAADFDGDGSVDLAILYQASPIVNAYAIAMMHGHGNGHFDAPLLTSFDLPGISEVHRLVATDVSGDGVKDLVVLDTSGISVLLGFGDGYFRPPRDYGVGLQTSSTTNDPALVSADFNLDGRPDFAFWKGVGIGVALTGACTPFNP